MKRNSQTLDSQVSLALPSRGVLAEQTEAFLRGCGLSIAKTNPRQYVASMPAIPQIDVLFQRVADIALKVLGGAADIGITGLDVVREHCMGDDQVLVLHDSLKYGDCRLVIATPEAWFDVENMSDIADLAIEFREHKGRDLRVATKFPNLTRQFLRDHGIRHFALVKAEGAIEGAPSLGYADIVADLTATGTTLRENHLKELGDGCILESQACLIGNRQRLARSDQVLETVGLLLEYIDGALKAKSFLSVTANIEGESEEAVAKTVSTDAPSGFQGPAISRVYLAHDRPSQQANWYAVTLVVHRDDLFRALAHLRTVGGKQIIVTPTTYVFAGMSESYQRLVELIRR
jgi:ATP phosphoribosyltransferase